MTWFETLTGLPEESPGQVRANLRVDGNTLRSVLSGETWYCGELETPSLAELRERVHSSSHKPGKILVREVVADVQSLHKQESNAGALFQVASQFNLLEMVHPDVTPERGIGRYERDHTQGPACAIAAGAGTIYRNYFVILNGQTGQSAQNQIDCLADLGAALGNSDGHLWEMRNGYALVSEKGLVEISRRLRVSTEAERDSLRQLLRIGIQWDTQVTLGGCRHRVSQAYCSALPVAYGDYPSELWAEFASLVLEANYEATFCAAVLNAPRLGSNQLFLTLVGGGAFGNQSDWILGAIQRALHLYREADLDVSIVNYRASNPRVGQMIRQTGTGQA
jgi:hypothetical protein